MFCSSDWLTLHYYLFVIHRGFRRIFYHSLPDKTLAFYHRLFQKQSPELVKQMKMDGGEKEPALPSGASADAPPAAATATSPGPPNATQPAEAAAAADPSPASLAAAQALLSAQRAAAAPPANAAIDLSAGQEGQQALQQAMVAEQERSDVALQQLQAQQMLLRSLTEQQNSAQTEELLMQSMLAEQQRSDLQLQQRQAEQALVQQMMAEEQANALASALNGQGANGGMNIEALLRERLFAQQYANAGPAAAPSGSDILALLQQQLQGQQQQQAREPSYMEQLLLLEQQQRQQRQQEAALLAAHGFRFG